MQVADRTGLTALRILLAGQLVIHGIYRATTGGVAAFGGWLDSLGFPAGLAIASAITFVEIVGGATLVAGRLVRPLAAWFALQLTLGIAMVHFPEGWFVVGGGRNGMEYSVVLIGGFVIIALTAPRDASTGPKA